MEKVVADYHKEDKFDLLNYESEMYSDRSKGRLHSGVVDCTEKEGIKCNLCGAGCKKYHGDPKQNIDCSCRKLTTAPDRHSTTKGFRSTKTVVDEAGVAFRLACSADNVEKVMAAIKSWRSRIIATVNDFDIYVDILKPYVKRNPQCTDQNDITKKDRVRDKV